MTRYDLMKDSNTLDPNGIFYPDPLTIPLKNFQITSPVVKYTVKSQDVIRPDILFYKAHGTANFYDIVFMLNNKGYIDDVQAEDELYIPDRVDLENFFMENR